MLYAQRIDMSVAIVCMTNGTHGELPGGAENHTLNGQFHDMYRSESYGVSVCCYMFCK